jgi:hypothetical protein
VVHRDPPSRMGQAAVQPDRTAISPVAGGHVMATART